MIVHVFNVGGLLSSGMLSRKRAIVYLLKFYMHQCTLIFANKTFQTE